MIGVEKLYSGNAYSLMALTVSNKCLVKDFIEKLNEPEKKKILRLLTRTADNGLYTNEEKFRKMKTPRRRDSGVSLGRKTIILYKSPLAPLFQRGNLEETPQQRLWGIKKK